MELPRLSPYGTREVVLSGLVLGALALAVSTVHPALALLAVPPFLFVLFFFRDPPRRIPREEGAVVSAADGRVLEVTRLETEPSVGEPSWRITVFLSLLDVHVNRAPVGGRIESVERRRGVYHHAATERASAENESNDVVLTEDGTGARVLLRQIAGRAARRIVFARRAGDHVERGERIGMIKFGSRTELYLPERVVAEVRVRPGDRVRGGSTVVAVLRRPS